MEEVLDLSTPALKSGVKIRKITLE